MSLRLDLTLIHHGEAGSRLALSLFNLGDTSLYDWHIEFAFTRKIIPESISCGDLKQTGSHCRLTPPDATCSLEPNQHFYTEFEVTLPHLTLQSYGILSAVLCCGEHHYPIQLSPLNLGPDAPIRHKLASPRPEANHPFPIIPQPVELQPLSGHFTLDSHCVLCGEGNMSEAALWLQEELQQQCQIELTQQAPRTAGGIYFNHDKRRQPGSYILTIDTNTVQIHAIDSAGFHAAVATLLQLIPLQPNDAGAYFLPCTTIKDSPRFHYRGMMLDCARHFHSVETIKQLIDQLARLKFNMFHWHLTDDEGWRIEIPQLPALTDIGAWRGPEEVLEAQYSHFEQRYGGYYRQEEIREIIAYARRRGITVIPEIDIPGHCRAAIKSLPELLVDPDDKSIYESIQNYPDNVLSPALDGTYEFIRTVLDEVCQLFPAPYVHIGADEVPKGVWVNSERCQQLMRDNNYQCESELQGHLLRYCENYLEQKGKRMLGWEEAVNGDKVSTNTIIYSWTNENAGLACIERGFDVVMQPAQALYLDLIQANCVDEPGIDWAGVLPLKTVYDYNALSAVPDSHQHHILGIQTALWSEVVSTPQGLNFMLFPRLFAVAECAWSQHKDWSNFQNKLNHHLNFLDTQGITYRPLDHNE
ncbi:beta-N-acetylhexosaminidase [Thaumasiovibrio sp. DFM-14]|uniref:beta-N-acetylhexosaminidase n=1 Tax=Thaumasiovibrio sp. DFM-14 TaxID=3384792 RepID=UPI0039A1CE89